MKDKQDCAFHRESIVVKWESVTVDRFMRPPIVRIRPRAYCTLHRSYVQHTDRVAKIACNKALHGVR